VEFPIDRPVVRIGRGSGVDVYLQDSQVSRQHTEITQQGDQTYIRDLGSTNGTFVNDERITGPRLLRPGDQIRIGDTLLVSQAVGVAGAPVAAAGPSDDWESELWGEDATEAHPASGGGTDRSRLLIWGLVGAVVVLLVAVAVVAALTLGGGKETPTPMAMSTTEAAPSAVVVSPTETQESGMGAEPTVTSIVDVEVPTVEVDVPAVGPAVEPTVEVPAAPSGGQAPSAPQPPEGVPTTPGELEQLPALVQDYLGNVPPEQLPQAIATQLQGMSQNEVQEMIGALFPGVDLSQLPQVVAASFPGLSTQEVQGLLTMVFPGQNVDVPEFGGPIGGKIALGIYVSSQNRYDLYLADTAFEQPRLLSENAGDPGFSPDGQFIVYHSSAPDKGGLRIMRIDGSEDRALTSVASDRNPRFSPDGTRILFSNVDNNTLSIINRDGTGRRDVGQGKFPDWSPNGNQIVYQGCVGGGKCGLIVAGADGSNPRQITTHANDTMPRWEYGNVAFMSDRDGNFEVYVINPDGTWLRRITLNPATDIMPVWDPSGIRLAFRSDRGGDRAVYTTSGIGGGDFKQFGAEFGADWMLAGMDWGK